MHFVDENSQRPPVNCFTVPLVQNNFWSDVLRSSTNRKRPALVQKFSKPKVSKFEVAVVSNEQIFRFQISEDDIFAMQIFEAGGNNGAVEAGLVSGERFNIPQVGEKFSSVD